MYQKPTQALWKQVEHKIDDMFKERITYALDWYKYGLSKHQFDLACMRSLVTPEEDVLVHQLGEKWLTKSDEIGVAIHNGHDWDNYQLPAKAGGRTNYVSPLWTTYHTSAKPKIQDPTIKDVAQRRHEAYRKIISEREEFKKKVKEVWEQAPSLNALAKIWPPIIDLLPTGVVQKINEKNERRTTKQLSENVDTKSLSVHILKAKVGQ
jgi:hypothetical protein